VKRLVDTNTVSELNKSKNPHVLRHVAGYLLQHGQLTFSLITYYEILRGFKAVKATTKLSAFEAFCKQQEILPVNSDIIVIAADLWASLKTTGRLIEDCDLFVAATALHHGLPLVTGNVAHFNRIPGLIIEDWTKP
jgi:tRNA(fMet)-specific endonuclease VapC